MDKNSWGIYVIIFTILGCVAWFIFTGGEDEYPRKTIVIPTRTIDGGWLDYTITYVDSLTPKKPLFDPAGRWEMETYAREREIDNMMHKVTQITFRLLRISEAMTSAPDQIIKGVIHGKIKGLHIEDTQKHFDKELLDLIRKRELEKQKGIKDEDIKAKLENQLKTGVYETKKEG